MTEENTNTSNNKAFIIAAAVLVLVVIFMYFRDQKQQRAYELQGLERRVELIEEWGRPRHNMPWGGGGAGFWWPLCSWRLGVPTGGVVAFRPRQRSRDRR